ncbi:MAG TPA: hypothetical protein VK919_03635 [Solirubrobacterales bacterium]|nr:hypothetical protein [Solirubrobacterales bacterium]
MKVFRDGETGDDARGFRRAVGEVVESEGDHRFRQGSGCTERGRFISTTTTAARSGAARRSACSVRV